MTTTVNIQAHCSPDKCVLISVTGQPDRVISNGETCSVAAFDERIVSVKEVLQTDFADGAVAAPVA